MQAYYSVILALQIAVILVFVIIAIKTKSIFSKTNTFLYPVILVFGALLYFPAIYTAEIGFWRSVVAMFEAVSDTIKLDFPTDTVKDVYSSLLIFRISISIHYLTSVFSFANLFIYIGFKSAVNFFRKKLFALDNYIVVLGYNEQSKVFLKSVEGKVVVWDENLTSDDEKELFEQGYAFIKKEYSSKYLKSCIRQKRTLNVVSFLKNDKDFSKILTIAEDIIKTNKNVYFYLSSKSYQGEHAKFVSDNSSGKITLFNDYDLISLKFISDNYLGKLLSEKNTDFSSATLKENAKINVNFIGFGKVGQRLLPYLFSDSVFVKREGKTLKSVPFCVNVFDKNEEFVNFDLSSNLLRHKKKNYISDDYFDTVEGVENFTPILNCNVGSVDFYEKIDLCVDNNNEHELNLFIISIGEDLENMETAINIKEYFSHKSVKGVCKYFVRTTSSSVAQLKAFEINKNDIIPFGMIDEILTYNTIIKEKLTFGAQKRAMMYNQHNNNYNSNLWENLSHVKRMSNIFSMLNVSNKLALMGYKISATKNQTSANAFLSSYNPEGNEFEKIDYSKAQLAEVDSVRDALCAQEHFRWNSYMISQGYVPMEKNQIRIEDENGEFKVVNQNPLVREHCCITSLKGLDEYHVRVAQIYSTATNLSFLQSREKTDTLVYDYQVMDELYKGVKAGTIFVEKIY